MNILKFKVNDDIMYSALKYIINDYNCESVVSGYYEYNKEYIVKIYLRHEVDIDRLNFISAYLNHLSPSIFVKCLKETNIMQLNNPYRYFYEHPNGSFSCIYSLPLNSVSIWYLIE